MGNVLRILKRDLVRLLKSPAALVVVVALLLLPSAYTWYNVVGFWNPYDNTGNLRVCVVNEDKGGASEVTGEVDVGAMIVDQLHENKQMNWDFTDYDTAMDALYAGSAYAVLVIPEHFTDDLLTVTTGDFTQPKIDYYVNEKLAPVAAKITDTGATTLDEMINSAFVKTVSDVVVSAIDEKASEAEGEAADTRSRAVEKVDAALSAIGEVRVALGKLGQATEGAQDKVDASRVSLDEAKRGIEDASADLDEMVKAAKAAQTLLRDFSAFAVPAVGDGMEAASGAATKANAAAGELARAVGMAQGFISTALSRGEGLVSEGRSAAASLRELAGKLPDSDVTADGKKALEDLAAKVDKRTDAAQQALDALAAANERTVATSGALSDTAGALDGAVQTATGSITAYSTGLFGETLPAVNDALSALEETSTALKGALDSQTLLVDETGLVVDQLASTLGTARETVAQTDGLFADLKAELQTVRTDVAALGASDALSDLIGEDSLNAGKIADFMASPTKVVTKQLYHLNAYGSAMAPLFMNLTFWIGAFMLLVIMRQEADGEGIPNLTLGQRYWGRFLLLAGMAVVQALVCCAGVLVIGVEAASAPALFAAAAVASLAYLSIIYALSVTLQHIGKGICIVLVFAQIPGATGLYPIEMTSPFFQAIYPFFPFTYGIGAMREAICGFYGNQYVADIAVLGLFFVLAMAFGLIVRPLMANVNHMVARQVREGGIFNGEDVDIPARPYRISQILRALSDKGGFGAQIRRRYERFSRWYPRLMRASVVLGVAVPLALALLFALTPTEKVVLLTGLLLWVVFVFVALVVIESLRYSFERQMSLEGMTDENLIGLFGERSRMRRASVPPKRGRRDVEEAPAREERDVEETPAREERGADVSPDDGGEEARAGRCADHG